MKTIISLDGGGIRGVISLQILAEIERLYQQERNNPDLVLADVVDFFAGTSTGALIATGLAWGMRVQEIEDIYFNYGPQLFRRAPWYTRWKSKYRAEDIGEYFKSLFKDSSSNQPALLGTRDLKTLLMVVVRNASTGSAWPVTNNPKAMFNQADLADSNLNIPLWQLLRASSAAPTYFPPQEIKVGDRTDLFVDGGITPYNNPALIAVLNATLPAYKLNWQTGTDQLQVISIGTGSMRTRFPTKTSHKIHMLDQVKHMIPALIGTISDNQDMLCRVLGECHFGAPIDVEVGDLMLQNANAKKKFSYVRYDMPLDHGVSAMLTKEREQMDNLALMPQLKKIGIEYATSHVNKAHFQLI